MGSKDEPITTITKVKAEAVEEAEKNELKLIDERDSLENRLDSLSEAVAVYFDEDIGEHSSANDPWYNAFELLRERTPTEKK